MNIFVSQKAVYRIRIRNNIGNVEPNQDSADQNQHKYIHLYLLKLYFVLF